MKFLFLTKTEWNEPPRIRHQLAKLLAEKDNQVIFVEKPNYKFGKASKDIRIDEHIRLIQHTEVIHHQLRPFSFIQKLNSKYVVKKLKKLIKMSEVDLVINFNYDYTTVLKYLNKPSITIINDDFIAQGKFWMKNAIANEMKKICEVSNYTLAVSFPLVDMLKVYSQKVELFLPWAPVHYDKPKVNKERDVVLYYGYVSRIDWSVIESILENNIRLRIVGPKTKKSLKMIDSLKAKYFKLEVYGYTSFEDLNTDDVCCSIAPYDLSIENTHKITANNRMFRLLSKGIPLLFPDLDSLMKADKNILRKCESNHEFILGIEFFKENFFSVQKDIEKFLKGHYSSSRFNQLERIINRVV